MIRLLHRPQLNQTGFTLVELMIASLLFTVILGIITSGIVHFTADYYKGVHTSTTQTTARNIINIISQNLQYGGGSDSYITATNGYNQAVCIGDAQIDYVLGAQLGKDTTINYGVFVTRYDSTVGCQTYSPGRPGKELLAPKMRLTDLSVTQVPNGTSSGHRYLINAGVAYGDDDLICSSAIIPDTLAGGCKESAPPMVSPSNGGGGLWTNANGITVKCRSRAASQFCAYSHLNTQVVTRF